MPEQLRIAMISLHSCPLGKLGERDTGGMNVYIRELARELGEKGHIVDIYTRTHQPEHEQVIDLGNNTRLIHIETGATEEIPKIAFYSYLERFICGVENFRSSNINSRYDLIHSHYWLSGLAGKHLQLWWHVPHITMFHTLGAVKNSIGIGEEETELRIEGEREVINSCEQIIAATATEKKDLIYYYHARQQNITVLPCGVNPDIFKPIDKETAIKELGLSDQSTILYVGRIEQLKGLGQLLKAMNYIKDSISPRLLIVGGDEFGNGETQALYNLADELQIKDKVLFQGSVPHETLPLYYSAADICVIPSYYESFGMVALESLACGTPVLATDVGDMKNIIRSDAAGYIIDSNSPDRLAEKLSELLSNGKKQLEDAEIRRSLISDYNWREIADRILLEYESAIENYSTPVPAAL
ncbi:glycosyltransferase [Chloroflexota bacterium]